MSLTTELANLAAVVATESTAFEQALKAKVQNAVTADNAGTLSLRTSGQVSTDLDAPLVAHVNNKLAHAITAAQLGTMDGSAVDALLAKRPAKGIIPVSRYGTLNYLPAGVSGSFEGATTGIAPRECCLFLENDGTLAYLRNGTNGSKLGVYYGYVLDALGPVLNQPIKTTRQYRPGYFPINVSAAYIQSSSETAIFGRLQNASGVLGDWFLSLTNGSLDDSVHTGCIITNADVVALGIGRGEALVSGALVLLLTVNHVEGGVLEVLVHTLTRIGVNQGGTLTPTRLTGITSTGFGNVVYTGDSAKLCAKSMSQNAADNPAVYKPDANGFAFSNFEIPSIRSYSDGAGNTRCKIVGMTNAPSSQVTYYNYYAISFVINVSAKTCVLDPIYRASQSTVTRTGDANSPTVWTGPVWNNDWVTECWPGIANNYSRHLYSGKWVFNFRTHQVVDTLDLMRVEMTAAAATPFAALLRGTSTAKTGTTIGVQPSYGSAIGGVILGPYPLSDNRAMVYCKGSDINGQQAEGMAFSDLAGAPTFGYNSIQNGAMTGYAPNANRKFVKDVPMTDADFWAPLVETGTTSIAVSSQHFIEGFRWTGFRTINPDLSKSGSLGLTDALLQNTKAAMIAAIGLTGIKNAKIQIWVPKILMTGKAFAAMQYTLNNGENGVYVGIFNVTVAGDSITALALTSLSPKFTWLQANQGGLDLQDSNYIIAAGGAVTMYETTTSVLFGLTLTRGFLVNGNAPSGVIRFRINKSTGVPNWGSNADLRIHNPQVNGAVWYGSPTLGFGLCYTASAETDYGAKVSHMLVTKNSDAEFDSWAVPAASQWKVIMSQDVAATWQLYFTEPTPLMINGQTYTVAKATFDLTAIKASPANTRFYVYVTVTGGVARYVVQLAFTGESSTSIYLGYVDTGATSIQTVAIEKVTKINYFRISAVSRGSAVAATTGDPAGSATLQWS
jgi:hypothetical protein